MQNFNESRDSANSLKTIERLFLWIWRLFPHRAEYIYLISSFNLQTWDRIYSALCFDEYLRSQILKNRILSDSI